VSFSPPLTPSVRSRSSGSDRTTYRIGTAWSGASIST
jgi:hypothetical protein